MAKRVLSKKKKRTITVVTVVALVVVLLVVGLSLTGSNSTGTAYVQSVSAVSGNTTAGGVSNVYSGVAQSGKTVAVAKDGVSKVAKVYVAAGTKVKKGDILFEYDLSQNNIDLKQATLELQKLNTELDSHRKQLDQYKKLKKEAESKAEELEYETQIINTQTSIKETQYSIEAKNLEIQNLHSAASSAHVKSPITGAVKSVNAASDDEYITIVATGNISVRGVISEQNVSEISVGESVVVRSRVDDSVIWRGTISDISDEPVEDSKSVSKASQYSFTVTLTSDDGLKLGQHVYIEADYGQTKQGSVSLPAYYIVNPDSSPYVWAADSRGKLAKRSVTLGKYNSATDCYEVEKGLSASDYIAWPSDQLKEGQKAIASDEGEV